MARQRLTDRTLKALRPAQKGKHYDRWDAIVPGLGVRVSDTGRKTFVLLARFAGRKNPTRRAVGEYGAITLYDARKKARVWLEMIQQGKDPALEEERQRQSEHKRAKTTFAAVAEDFISEKLPKERQGDEAERIIRRDLMPTLGKLPIASITEIDCIGVVKAKAKNHPTQAWHVFSVAKRLFGWAKEQRIYGLKHNPWAEMKPKSYGAERSPRDRALTDDEIFALWRATKLIGYPAGPAYRLLLITALRLNEAVGAAKHEFNWRDRKWIIPKERMKLTKKGPRAHAVPLIDDIKEIIDALPQNSGDYLLSYDFGKSAAVLGHKVKTRIDRRMLRTLRALARVRGEDSKLVRLEPWKNLDLRRTVRTNLSRLRVPETFSEAVLAHARPGVKGIYDVHEFFDEKREALESWAARLRSIITLPPRNVVQFKGWAQEHAGS